MSEGNFSSEIPKIKERETKKDINLSHRTTDFKMVIWDTISVVNDNSKDTPINNEILERNINTLVTNQDILSWWLDPDKMEELRLSVANDLKNKKNEYGKELDKEEKIGSKFKSLFSVKIPRSEEILYDIETLSEKNRSISKTEQDQQITSLSLGIDYLIQSMVSSYESSSKETREKYAQSLDKLGKILAPKIDLIDKNIGQDDSEKNRTLLNLIKRVWRLEGSYFPDNLGYSEKETDQINDKCAKSFINHFDLIKKGLQGEDQFFYKELLKSLSINHPDSSNEPLMAEKLIEVWNEISPKKAIDIVKSFYFGNTSLGNSFIYKMMEMYGIKKENTKLIMGSWDEQLRNADNFGRVIEDNLSTIANIENELPGCTKILNEKFNICNFGRYPESMLIRQVKEIDDKKIDYGIVIFPFADHNYAFHNNQQILNNLDNDLIFSQHTIRIFESKSKIDLVKTFLKLKNQYGKNKPKFLLLGGHGNPESINLGQRYFDYSSETDYKYLNSLNEHEKEKYHNDVREKVYRRKNVTTEDLVGNSAEFIKNSLAPQAKVVLISCSTGVAGGIGEKLSKFLGPDISVIAPDKYCSAKKIEADLENNELKMKVSYNNANSIEYKNGQARHNS